MANRAPPASNGCPSSGQSGADVGRAQVEQLLDPVLEVKLALLEAGKLQLIDGSGGDQDEDFRIERAVLGPQFGKFGVGIVIVHVRQRLAHRPRRRNRLSAATPARRSARRVRRADKMTQDKSVISCFITQR